MRPPFPLICLALLACKPSSANVAVEPELALSDPNPIIDECSPLADTDTVAFRDILPYNSLEPFRRCWYTQFLRALKEPALQIPSASPDVTYRFLYLPTFRPAISVRIERRVDIRMTVSQTEGWGGYDPKGRAWTRTVLLKQQAWDSLELALVAASVWSDTLPEGPGGLDGSQWILEGVRSDRRILHDRWSPQVNGPDEAFRRAGNYILDLAGIPADARD